MLKNCTNSCKSLPVIITTSFSLSISKEINSTCPLKLNVFDDKRKARLQHSSESMEDLYINFWNISKEIKPSIYFRNKTPFIYLSIYLPIFHRKNRALAQKQPHVFHLLGDHFHRESLRRKEIKHAGTLIWHSVATRITRRAAKHLNWMPNRYVLIIVSNTSVIYTHRMRYNETMRLVLLPFTSSPFLYPFNCTPHSNH